MSVLPVPRYLAETARRDHGVAEWIPELPARAELTLYTLETGMTVARKTARLEPGSNRPIAWELGTFPDLTPRAAVPVRAPVRGHPARP